LAKIEVAGWPEFGCVRSPKTGELQAPPISAQKNGGRLAPAVLCIKQLQCASQTIANSRFKGDLPSHCASIELVISHVNLYDDCRTTN